MGSAIDAIFFTREILKIFELSSNNLYNFGNTNFFKRKQKKRTVEAILLLNPFIQDHNSRILSTAVLTQKKKIFPPYFSERSYVTFLGFSHETTCRNSYRQGIENHKMCPNNELDKARSYLAVSKAVISFTLRCDPTYFIPDKSNFWETIPFVVSWNADASV